MRFLGLKWGTGLCRLLSVGFLTFFAVVEISLSPEEGDFQFGIILILIRKFSRVIFNSIVTMSQFGGKSPEMCVSCLLFCVAGKFL